MKNDGKTTYLVLLLNSWISCCWIVQGGCRCWIGEGFPPLYSPLVTPSITQPRLVSLFPCLLLIEKTRPKGIQIYGCRYNERLKVTTEGFKLLTDWVPWGTGTPKNRDEVKRREVWECDGWVCDLEVIDTPSTFRYLSYFLFRVFPQFFEHF